MLTKVLLLGEVMRLEEMARFTWNKNIGIEALQEQTLQFIQSIMATQPSKEANRCLQQMSSEGIALLSRLAIDPHDSHGFVQSVSKSASDLMINIPPW